MFLLFRNIYFGFCLLTALILLFCIIETFTKSTKVSKGMFRILSATFLTVLSFILPFFITNIVFAYFSYAVYFLCLDFVVYTIIRMEMVLAKKNFTFKELPLSSKILQFLVALDILFFLTNYFTKWFFELSPVYLEGKLYYWIFNVRAVFHFHLAICYYMAFVIFTKLIKDIKKSTKFYKGMYIVFLTFYLIEFLLNIVFIGFSDYIHIDYSLALFELFSILEFMLSLYLQPRNLQKRLLSVTSETLTDAVIGYDNNGKCIYKNDAGQQLMESADFDWVEKYFIRRDDSIFQPESIKVNGEDRIFSVEFHRFRDSKNRYSGCFFKLNDRTFVIKNLEREEYKATHDELTGLYNRNSFFAEMEKILKRSPEVPRYLICTDIKNFKLVNDLFGTSFGDNILRFQANMLNKANYQDCIKGRISGDRFAMMINKENFNKDFALMNSNAIQQFTSGVNYHMEICLGVYEIADPYENVHTMYDKANLAIKNVKNEYNTQMVFYNTDLMNRLMLEKSIISEFKYALETNQFFMFLQPQIDVKTGKCSGAEALVRWYDVEKGYRQPGEFIPILEKSGLIYQLDAYIWEKAAMQLREWKNQGHEEMHISVNISPKDFYYADLYKFFVNLVEKYGISPNKLNLEITETVIFDNQKLHRFVLKQLQDFGFHLEMDDFGSGYSSLNSLKELDMDVIKIDLEFLQKTKNEERGRMIVKSIVEMAKNLKVKVISEGVETEEQTKFLSDIGVDLFQGYFYSKPLSVRDFEHKYLEEKI